jgi:hypothetical protein
VTAAADAHATIEEPLEVVFSVGSCRGGGVGGGLVPIVESRCVSKPSEDLEDLVRAVVNCRVCELAIAL